MVLATLDAPSCYPDYHYQQLEQGATECAACGMDLGSEHCLFCGSTAVATVPMRWSFAARDLRIIAPLCAAQLEELRMNVPFNWYLDECEHRWQRLGGGASDMFGSWSYRIERCEFCRAHRTVNA